MLLPPPAKSMTFEKVALGEFITGIIEKIEHEPKQITHYQGEEKIRNAVRFVFKLDGYQYPHRTHWMTFSMDERSNLYKKYISKLVDNAKPGICFDLYSLVGTQVRTIWTENGDFQSIELIAPAGKKITVKELEPSSSDKEEFITEDQVVFETVL